MGTLPISRLRTKERFERRNRLKAKNRKGGRLFCCTPLGKRATADLFLKPLADFLAGRFSEKPDRPPGDLGELINGLDYETLALAALSPLLHAIHAGWEGRDTPSAEMLLKKQIGEQLRDRLALKKLFQTDQKAAYKVRKGHPYARQYLKSDWGPRECVAAGHWLLQSALSLDYFGRDEDGFPTIAPHWQTDIDRIHEDLLRRDPVLLPHTSPPPDWIGWLAEYGDRLQAIFVRDWRPETKRAIETAFSRNFEHARGVNALQRVPFRIDETMLALVERFAVDVMGHTGKVRENDQRTVIEDIKIARVIGSQPFWLAYNCDRRGRVYAIPHLNYGREDHVRSLFRFAVGKRLSPDDSQWLEIHCANSWGAKGPWSERLKWVNDQRADIKKIATDPIGTFDLWRDADKPFCYVAACRELVGAWTAPTDFVSQLPIAFDGSANGIQHLAMTTRDRDAARLTNLIDSDRPGDLYTNIIQHVRADLQLDSHKWGSDEFLIFISFLYR